MAIIGITGGSGFVGRSLTAKLARDGNEVIIFTRNPKPIKGFAHWDANKGEIDREALGKLDAVVHLAGAGVADKRWTAARKKEIYDSRISGTRFLVEALRKHAPNCRTLVSASAVGYYGESKTNAFFTEDAPPASDFLGRTCVDWEAEAQKAEDFCRVVMLRTGIVLGKGGGALPELTKTFPLRIAPILGNGKQWVSWIHLADLIGLYDFVLENKQISGPFNAVAPQPVTHRMLMNALVKAKGGAFLKIPVPAFILKLALGEMSVEVLKSCGVSSEKSIRAGYDFQFSDITGAAKNLLR